MTWLDKTAEKIFQLAVVSFTILYTAYFLFISYHLVPYPYFIDWTEGDVFLEAMRIRHGLPIYTEPSLDYVASIYTPLYFYVTALASYIAGSDFISGRLISFLATITTCILLYILLRMEKLPRPLSAMSIGIYLSFYFVCGQWFDVIRPDSLLLLFMMFGLLMLRHGVNKESSMLAGAALALAFLTKQNSAISIVCMLAGHYWLMPKRTMLAGLTFIVLAASASCFLQYTSDGWFFFYILELPLNHPHDVDLGLNYGTHFRLMMPLFPLAIASFVLADNPRNSISWLVTFSGFLIATLMTLKHLGSYFNDFMPLCLVLAITAPVGLFNIINLEDHLRKPLIALAGLLILLQFSTMYYNPERMIPKQADKEAFDSYMDWLAKADGEVLIVNWNYIQSRVDKTPHGYGFAGNDILRMDTDHPVKKHFSLLLKEALEKQDFKWILINADDDVQTYAPIELARNYYYVGEIINNGNGFPVTGGRVRPSKIYLVRD